MFYSRQNWAFSSTGNFMDDDADSDDYIKTNISALYNVSGPVSELYRTARVSPVSLTYYGLCLLNGNYSVKLHFAETVFTNDSSFSSLGRRIFDVYLQVNTAQTMWMQMHPSWSVSSLRFILGLIMIIIRLILGLLTYHYISWMQGNLVLKDFNIAADAGGPGKPIIKTFTAAVTSQTLKIHLYWAGRGTQGIPDRGTYGPLISAISVDPSMPFFSNFKKTIFRSF